MSVVFFLKLAMVTFACEISRRGNGVLATTFTPVMNFNRTSFLCASATPIAVVLAHEIIDLPEFVPDCVRCGYACSSYANCTSYNCAEEQWSEVTPVVQCQLFTDVPLICEITDGRNCIHYELSSKRTSCRGCPPSFIYVIEIDSCFFLVNTTNTLSISVASDRCAALHSHLAYIVDERHQSAASNFLNKSLSPSSTSDVRVWIGGCRNTSSNKADSFVWSTQCTQSGPPSTADIYATMTYANFASGEPNNYGYSQNATGSGEWCVGVSSALNWGWNDDKCVNSNHATFAALCQSDVYTVF